MTKVIRIRPPNTLKKPKIIVEKIKFTNFFFQFILNIDHMIFLLRDVMGASESILSGQRNPFLQYRTYKEIVVEIGVVR